MNMKVRKILATTVAAAAMMSFAGCTINVDKDLAERIVGEVSEGVENGDISISTDANTTIETTAPEVTAPEATAPSAAETSAPAVTAPSAAETSAPAVTEPTELHFNTPEPRTLIYYIPNSDFYRIMFSENRRFIGDDRATGVGYADNYYISDADLYRFTEEDTPIYIECRTIAYYPAGSEFTIEVYKDDVLYLQETTYAYDDNCDTVYFSIANPDTGLLEAGRYVVNFTGFDGCNFATCYFDVDHIGE